MVWRSVAPQNFSGCAGPGTLVITAVAFLANRPSHGVLHRLDEQPRHRQHGEGQQRLVAALELGHARRTAYTRSTGFSMPIGSTSGARPKRLPSLPGLFQRAQVDRHHGADLLARGVVAAVAQVLADGAGHAGQQHVVDRAVQRLADDLHRVQRQRLVPGHDLAAHRLALEPRGFESSGISASAADVA
jgi:hypothetical protein